MFFDQVEVLGDRRVLGQDADGPPWLGEDGFQATSSKIVVLGGGCPGIDGRAKLDDTAFLDPLGVLGHPFGDFGVDDGIAHLEGALAQVLESLVAAQEGTAGTVGAIVAALEADVDGVLGKALFGEFGADLIPFSTSNGTSWSWC